MGRFISPDDTDYFDPSMISGMNLYAYCGNNPVMYSDPSGNSLILTLVLVGLAAGAAIGFGGTIYSDYKDDGQVFNGSKSVGEYIKNTVIGGVVGAGIGAAVGITAPMMGSFLASSFSIGLPHVVGNTLVATSATVTGAQIAGTAAAVAGLVYLYERKPVAPRIKNNSKKQAYEKAFRKGGKKKPRGPENHGKGWHFHPSVPKNSKYFHWHYYFTLIFGLLNDQKNFE